MPPLQAAGTRARAGRQPSSHPQTLWTNRKAEILHILNISAQKPDSTGSGVYLNEMVRAMVRAGHDVAVIAGIGPADAPALPEGTLFRPVRFETPELPFCVCGMSDEMPYASTRYRDMTPAMVGQFERAFAAAMREVDEAFQPDLVLCHHLYLVTAIARETLPHRRVAAISHSTDLRQMRSHGLERERIARGIRGLNAVLSLHTKQRRLISEVYGIEEERIGIVGTGYNAQVFRMAEDEESERGNDGRVASEAARTVASDPAVCVAIAASDLADNPDAGVASTASAAADALVTNNATTASAAASCSPADDDTPTASTQELTRTGLVYAGKISIAKGVESLVAALELVRADTPLPVRLAGGSGAPEEYTRIVELAAQSPHDVQLLGKLTQPELAHTYHASDVFVLASFYEGLPLVVIEALACGCKVVVTDLPGIRPWLDANLPGAPIFYVTPPHMIAVDAPDPADLPAFEQRLAHAIERALAAPPAHCDTTALSWDNLAKRAIELAMA